MSISLCVPQNAQKREVHTHANATHHAEVLFRPVSDTHSTRYILIIHTHKQTPRETSAHATKTQISDVCRREIASCLATHTNLHKYIVNVLRRHEPSEMCTLRVSVMSGLASVGFCRPDTIAGTHARTVLPSIHLSMCICT